MIQLSPPPTPPSPLTVSFLSYLFQMAAKLGQLGVYMSSVLTNPSAGAVQPVNQAAGIAYQDQQGIVPTSPAGIQQTQGPASAGSPSNTNPVGLKSPTQQAATVQTPAEPKLRSTQGDLVWERSQQKRQLIIYWTKLNTLLIKVRRITMNQWRFFDIVF